MTYKAKKLACNGTEKTFDKKCESSGESLWKNGENVGGRGDEEN